ncbi:PepSY domain-containing protein [Roseibium sp.]|uniref:PepSY domain-containing protein n=1 Tax=Roseibium sp. TaxID=1936156 RepID=UPI003A98747D
MKRLMIFLVLMLAAAAPANAQCLSQAQAREAVASGKAKSLGSVAGAAGGEIVKAELCQQGGGYVYRLSVRINGQVVTKTVNASR